MLCKTRPCPKSLWKSAWLLMRHWAPPIHSSLILYSLLFAGSWPRLSTKKRAGENVPGTPGACPFPGMCLNKSNQAWLFLCRSGGGNSCRILKTQFGGKDKNWELRISLNSVVPRSSQCKLLGGQGLVLHTHTACLCPAQELTCGTAAACWISTWMR